MDKLKGLIGGKGDKTSGSSTAKLYDPAEEARKTAQGKIDVTEFVKKVEALASGSVTGEHIEALAGMVGKVLLMVSITGSADYWVGLKGMNKVSFAAQQVNDPKYKIPHSVPVHTTQSDNLVIKSVMDNKKKTKTLESFEFKQETYKALDLTTTVSPARCYFILTTQLSGCTFATGRVGTTLYMGHAQRKKDVEFAGDGEQVSSSLKEKRKTMFQNAGNLESTLLISLGKKFKIDKSESDSHCIITYPGYADVIGVACNKNIYFIVAFRSDTDTVDKVVLVTQETGTKKWKTKEMKKTW